jgi:hypothetical protein
MITVVTVAHIDSPDIPKCTRLVSPDNGSVGIVGLNDGDGRRGF